MNLYIFNESSRAAVYGIGTYIRELTAALRHSHINICEVYLRSDKLQMQVEERDEIRHWYFPSPLSEQRIIGHKKQNELYYRSVVYLLQLHVKNKKGLIFHLNYGQSSELAEALKNAFDCKIVAVVHYSNWGFSLYDNPQRLRSILNEEHPGNLKKSFEEEKSFYSKADMIICLSDYMHEILCRDYGLDAKKISVIPNGLTDVADTAVDKGFLRKKWSVPAKEKVILFAGRMDTVKGLEYAIKAFREVLQTCPRCRLVIAGDGAYKKYTEESRDVCTHVTYAGLLDAPQLYEWYRLADVGVVPSLFEPFGYVAVEMMMHELPVVVTATSGLDEVIDGACGVKVPLTRYLGHVEIDTSLLAQKILYLLQHPAEARQMGRNGRKRYLRHYSGDVFRRNMLQLYESLIQQ